MNSKLMFENYKNSLKQKYNAICLDIDGTITTKGSKYVDSRVIEMIIELLNKKIPIVFITGRGETGLNDLITDIYTHINKDKRITNSELKRIYVLTNDGARLFYSEDTSRESFLKKSVYVSSEEELKQLLDFNYFICDYRIKNSLENYFDITYSKDYSSNTILNVRLVFKTKDEKIINLIFDELNDCIGLNNYNNIFLTRGIYKDNAVIQAGTAKKDIAICRTEKIIGVPQNSMLRIGDCGDIRGNDFEMLNCKQGYSVDKISENTNACFPIYNEDGRILKGIDATLFLLKNAKILPTICLKKAERCSYVQNFAKIERKIVHGRKQLLSKFNCAINNNFNDINGIDSIFDKYSGSIKIPMYEWYLLGNNPLKELWASTNDGLLKYSIRDDENYLLRGSTTYYYYLANRISNNRNDNTSKLDVINWHINYINFLNDAYNAFSQTKDINDSINRKMVLGILDNCRNILLIILNQKLSSNYHDKNIILDISSVINKDFYNCYQALLLIDKLMSNICFETDYKINCNEIEESIINTKNILINNLSIEKNSKEMNDYSKIYRAYREIDNFGENYVAVSLYSENCNELNNISNSCGMSYGGIELPIISKIINQNKLEKIMMLKFNKAVSGYTNKQLIDLRNFNIEDFGGIIGINDIKNSNIDLFDDNVLTGKTLQLAINSLYDFNVNIKNICVVRYPGINRIDQMFFPTTSAIDFNLFFDYIYGLCFSSPYSWKDDEWKNENGWVDYRDSIGVFDVNRRKIIEYLVKNHDFKENSEVGEYKRRLLK